MPLCAAALIRRDDRILVLRRDGEGDLAFRWELPGGKVDEGETPRAALARELAEELGVASRVGTELARARFVHREIQYEVTCFSVEADTGSMTLLEHTDRRWCTYGEALDLDLAPSDRDLITQLAVRDRPGGPRPLR